MSQTQHQSPASLNPVRFRARYLSALMGAGGLLALAAGCSDGDSPNEPGPGSTDDAGAVTDAGGTPSPEPTDSGTDGGGASFGGLEPTISATTQDIDLFGASGHRFWLEVSEEQRLLMNAETNDFGEDIYFPGGNATYADHMVIQAAPSGSVADYGKTQVRLIGESTARAFDPGHIPNFRIDTNHFHEGLRVDGFEHIRLNNAQVGSIFREHLTHRIYRELGYPALRSSFAFAGSNVWGEGIWVPMTLIEVYKLKFCTDNAEVLGGNCVNMWEFAGDLGQGGGGFPGGPGFPIDIVAEDIVIDPGPLPDPGAQLPFDACQIDSCDNQRLDELSLALSRTYRGPGFKEALEPYIEWDRFHEFQCLSWMLWVGDDPIHNSNNNLIIEREDGKLIWAPYSVDISAGQSWYTNVPLTGSNSIASGCQLDPVCWEDTIAACEDLIQRFDDLNPEEMVDETVTQLTELGMMRDGDEDRAQELRDWFVYRQDALATELEYYRYLPDENGNCPNDLMQCLDMSCGTPDQCLNRCAPGEYWCDSKEGCVSEFGDFCPACPDDEPLWCDLQGHRQCVASQDACYALCEGTPGQAYCPMFEQCLPVEECSFGFIDSGVIPGGGDSGLIPMSDASTDDAGDGG